MSKSVLIWFYTLIPALDHGKSEEGPQVSGDLSCARPQC